MILPRNALATGEEALIGLVARQVYYGNRRDCYYYGNCRSNWDRWGRWVLAGILIFLGLFLFFLYLCCANRRRRRRMNNAPTPMTAHNPGYSGYHPQQPYAPPPGPPPPQYVNGNGNAPGGYYGQQSGGLTQPQGAYMK
ncbi:uncharacterized protein L3040_005786 [Drepanopeziza brunnea f. sp. 'multigermtubi']|uniref:Chitin synthesis regulation, Congo red resistance, RCR protein n=1 Tax=Marssonina brunnea f. sp. multigermtubi (strain MB_m1) TaxID=1072389 RepID=K1WKY6_MARBU|nr:uncharacterized protein MBM_08881 [Drepanopeziza brunnea f. sp. 'multigermtubi' MB_m1]EKD12927.1 hypothetical protein MBM_08881 [Drepanopeziza brunnea f. sp. 'multigermtubi' MB_m1]KAJ5041238.1 hypothetical protein L3040_005786 [Drepanopeziza brunnea f. sp. 'multigermtubi']